MSNSDLVLTRAKDLIVEKDAEIASLKAELKLAREALKPFAAITPSSFYPEDGSQNEAYCVILKAGYGNHPSEFTGADLARARAFLDKGKA